MSYRHAGLTRAADPAQHYDRNSSDQCVRLTILPLSHVMLVYLRTRWAEDSEPMAQHDSAPPQNNVIAMGSLDGNRSIQALDRLQR